MGWMHDLLLGSTEATMRDVNAVKEHTDLLLAMQRRASSRISDRELEIAVLKDELARQKLAVEALTRFLIERKIVDQDELVDFIKDVDAQDGVVDGKLAIDTSRKRLKLVVEKKSPRKMIIPEKDDQESAE